MDVDSLAYHYQITRLWEEEDLSRYKPGGYQPVHLGDTFKDARYRIIHKLGWGGFSTAWLARDSQQQQWVCLKILTADGTCHSREPQTLHALQSDDATNHVVRLLDQFVHAGPNGSHLCLVFELLGPSVDYVVRNDYEPDEHLEPDTILRITVQLLEGLAYVHEAGYAQGDTSARNVAFTGSRLENCSEEELIEILGAPDTEALNPTDGEPLEPGLPRYVVGSTHWSSWMYEDDEEIRLIDWGEAFAHGHEPAKIAQPFGLNAPETIFTSRVDHRIDLWRAGCIIHFLVFSQYPFQANGLDGLISHMINFVEDLPAEWRPKWEEMKRTTTNTVDGTLEDEKPEIPRLEQKFGDLVHEPKLQCLLPVMQGLLKFFPENRISAADALDLALLEVAVSEGSVESHEEIK